MSACGGDLQSTLDIFLSHDLGEVRQLTILRRRLPLGLRLQSLLTTEVSHQFFYILHAIDSEAIRQRSLGGVGSRDVQLADTAAGGKHGHGQHAHHRPQLTGKAQLTQKRCIRWQAAQLLRRRQQSQKDGQVVHRALLADTGRGQVHGDMTDRELGPAVFDGGADTLAGLLHRRVGQAHHIKGRQTAGDHTLHRYLIAADAV